MSKIDEFVKKWCMKFIECMKGDDYIMYDEEECHADFRSTVESLFPSDEERRMEQSEYVTELEERAFFSGQKWLRSRLLAAIDANEHE